MAWPVLPHGFLGAQGSETDNYQIQRSLRFNSADSAYLNRTPASAGNRKTWTWSGWVKLGNLGTTRFIFGANSGGTAIRTGTSSDTIGIDWNGGTSLRSTQVLRDVSSWGHLVVSVDTTQVTASNRIRVYWNGSEITSWATDNRATAPLQNSDGDVNNSSAHIIGSTGAGSYYDGYLTEIYLIDGQALTPSYFGETDPITGRWKAKAYTGDYGANGFYLNFSDNSGTTATTLGKDSAPISGTHTAANNWTPNNFSVTAGTGNDSLTDSPANYGTISTTLTDDTYQISRSLRFNSADSAYLSRTPASAGNRKTWTWSGWVKRTALSPGTVGVFEAASNASNRSVLFFTSTDTLSFVEISSGSTVTNIATNQVFKDFSSWSHIIISVDTTQSVSSERVKLYHNGTQITSFASSTYPSQNFDTQVNSTVASVIGAGTAYTPSAFINGYLTEIHFIDGQALTPDSFGVRDSNYLWKPKAYTGTYGTNGFYLNFSDNSGTTATTLGKDQAGSNNWTPNNFSVASGVGNDSLVDTPTYYGTDAGAGGEARGDYATLNPLQISGATSPTVTNGNLVWTGSNSAATPARIPATIPITSGKWYFEVTRTDNNGLGNYVAAGITNTNASFSTGQYGNNPTSAGGNSNEWALTDRGVACNGSTYTNISSTIGTVGQNDVIRVCVDMDNKKIWFGKNATFSGTPASNTGEAFSNLPASVLPLLYVSSNTTSELAANFGQRPFAYAAPSGFRALRDYNKIPVPTGGVVRGNYATYSSLSPVVAGGGSALATLANGNLDASSASASFFDCFSTFNVPSSGKWYLEWTITAVGTNHYLGIGSRTSWSSASKIYQNSGSKVVNGTTSSYGLSYTTNDVIGMALDMDAGTMTMYKNNSSQGVLASDLISAMPSDGWAIIAEIRGTASHSVNFGQRPWAYDAPFGFLPLCTTLLPTPTIKKPSSYMDVVTFTATGSNQSITGLNFSPDFVWIKNRANWAGNRHTLFDTTRGAIQRLDSSTTEAEAADNDLISFDANGFSGNYSGTTFVAWAWDEAPIAGMDIVAFTAPSGTSQSTVAHSLGVAPKMIITKNRDTSANNWAVFHSSACDTTSKFLQLNTTAALQTFNTVWGASLPTSSVFGVTGGGVAASGVNCIAYLFSEVEGFSKFGSYTGNGSSDGPFVWCGFRPRWVMIKYTTGSISNINNAAWLIVDSARDTSNVVTKELDANNSSSEATVSSILDFTSNGFKIRWAPSDVINSSGATYIFAAFAESPFKYARAR